MSKITQVLTWGNPGTSDGHFNKPIGLALGTTGIIYVSDTDNNRIQCFDSNGKFICKWGNRGSDDGEFRYPWGITVKNYDDNKLAMKRMLLVPELKLFPPGLLSICVSYIGADLIYVADFGNNRIQVFYNSDLGGDSESDINSPCYRLPPIKFIHKWGSRGNGDGQFVDPTSCAFSSRSMKGVNLIYVIDRGNRRINMFEVNGTINGDESLNVRFIRKWSGCDDYDHGYQLNYPREIIVIGNNYGPMEVSELKHEQTEISSDKYEVKEISKDVGHQNSELVYINDSGHVKCYRVSKLNTSSETNGAKNSSEINKVNNSYKVKFISELKMSPMSMLADIDINGFNGFYVIGYQHFLQKYKKDGTLICNYGYKCSWSGGMARAINPTNGTSMLYIADVSLNRVVVLNFK